MDIVGYVSEKTGIPHDTAEVAVALLLKFAKGKLGDKFDMVAQYVPGVNDLIAKAPEGGVMGSVGGMVSSMFGGDGEDSISGLMGQLTGAGVPPEKVPEAANAVVDYIGEQGNDEAKSLLSQAVAPS